VNNLDRNLKVLKKVANIINTNNSINWILVGSTNLAMHGVDVVANDIDIITDEFGAHEIDKLLGDFCTLRLDNTPAENIRSLLSKYLIDDVEIEVMGNLQTRLPDGEWSDLTTFDDKEIYTYEDAPIPTLSLEKELRGYTNLGRMEKAEKIKTVLNRK